MRRALSASLATLVAMFVASLVLIVSSASADNPADTPTTKFLTLTCHFNGQTTVSGWRGNPADSVIVWEDAQGTFATAVFDVDLPAHPNSFSVDTPPPTTLSDNNQPITQARADLDYGTGTFPVSVNASCS